MSTSAPAVESGPSSVTPPAKRSWGLRGYLDDPNPILLKELRSVFRTPLFIRFLYLSTGAIGLLIMMVGGIASSEMPPAEAGQVVFQFFFGTALFVLCLVAPAHAATSLTSERERGTYESLILSGMDPARIVRGKFLASFLMFTLVLVAFSPVVGIAFLFGGVSPLEVLFAFIGLEMVLACAVGYGLVISARVQTTRIAILLAGVSFAPTAAIATGFMAGFGELAERSWGINMSGPFWFTEALATRLFEVDTFLLVAAMPVYLTIMFVWLCIAAGIAGVRPAAEDRSTPFKLWACVAVVGQAVILGGIMTLVEPSDASEVAAAFHIGLAGSALFLALMFVNEPPLPPRIWELRQAERGPIGGLWRIVGPGAASTLRAAALIVALGGALAVGGTIVGAYMAAAPLAPDDQLFGVVGIGLGNVVVGLFALAFGMWLRVMLRSGVAARVLTLTVLIALVILPLLGVVVFNTRGFSGTDVPKLMLLSPIAHMLVGVNYIDKMGRGVEQFYLPLMLYGTGAVVFWMLVERRVRVVRAQVEEVRAQQQRRVEEAARARALEESQDSPEDVARALLEVGANPETVAELTDSIPPAEPPADAANEALREPSSASEDLPNDPEDSVP